MKDDQPTKRGWEDFNGMARDAHIDDLSERKSPPAVCAMYLVRKMMRLLQAAGLAQAVTLVTRETQRHLQVGADHGVIR